MHTYTRTKNIQCSTCIFEFDLERKATRQRRLTPVKRYRTEKD